MSDFFDGLSAFYADKLVFGADIGYMLKKSLMLALCADILALMVAAYTRLAMYVAYLANISAPTLALYADILAFVMTIYTLSDGYVLSRYIGI